MTETILTDGRLTVTFRMLADGRVLQTRESGRGPVTTVHADAIAARSVARYDPRLRRLPVRASGFLGMMTPARPFAAPRLV